MIYASTCVQDPLVNWKVCCFDPIFMYLIFHLIFQSTYSKWTTERPPLIRIKKRKIRFFSTGLCKNTNSMKMMAAMPVLEIGSFNTSFPIWFIGFRHPYQSDETYKPMHDWFKNILTYPRRARHFAQAFQFSSFVKAKNNKQNTGSALKDPSDEHKQKLSQK